MDWTARLIDVQYAHAAREYVAAYSEAVLFVGLMLALLVCGKFRTALILGLGGALFFANFLVLVQYRHSAIPLNYALSFVAVSIFLLAFLAYRLVNTA